MKNYVFTAALLIIVTMLITLVCSLVGTPYTTVQGNFDWTSVASFVAMIAPITFCAFMAGRESKES